MARVTVEDCVTKIPNRFDLVLVATQRARDLSAGVEPEVERENDKDPVIALREIAEGRVDIDALREALVSGLQKHVEVEEPEEDTTTILAAAEKEWAGITGEEGSGEATAGKAPPVEAAEVSAEADAAESAESMEGLDVEDGDKVKDEDKDVELVSPANDEGGENSKTDEP